MKTVFCPKSGTVGTSPGHVRDMSRTSATEVPFISVLILIISLCYDASYAGFKFYIVSCPLRQTIKTRSLKVKIGSIKVTKPVPIITPEKKWEPHIFCLTSLLCRYFLRGLNPTPIPPYGEHNTRKRLGARPFCKYSGRGAYTNLLPSIACLRRNPSSSTAPLSYSSRSQATHVAPE